jgi:hypothetical protein
MSETTRRNVIIAGAAGAAGAAVAVGAVGTAQAAVRRPHPLRAMEPVVAHVEDHAGDRVTLLVGEREIVVRDRDLVERLLDAAGGN